MSNVCTDEGIGPPYCAAHCPKCSAGEDCNEAPHPPDCGDGNPGYAVAPIDPADSLLALLHANAAGTASREDVKDACRAFQPEFRHASSCGLVFRRDRKCDCAVGEVHRLRLALAGERGLRAADATAHATARAVDLALAVRACTDLALERQAQRHPYERCAKAVHRALTGQEP